ncbi:HTH-type quorum sensing-dependent transcriptional regulator VjbR [Falsiruegeria litorea R37]|uniref:HTH-type quorum sensing-dependent transcriptional regulator VjbR n=1 Tax=Falsiruegeria litorea R37 TaxID=1200284 RepID=A0A1Y5TKX7_9RHOB|nr:LuxR family transcriptional regulator [Falsiruegeria litorea]SLN66498.1 HTH-type quorum sensing-dependent transcriptional regulator VjbR [Falsiruegeria litorea R37]
MGNTANLDQVLEALDATNGLEELQAISEALRDALDIRHIVYHWVDSAGDQYGCGTYPDTWVQRYVEQNYHRIDPVILGCFQRFHPVDWKRMDWSGKAAKMMLADALEHGVGNQGYSIPIRGPNGQFALFTANHNCRDDEWAAFTEAYGRDLLLIAHYFNRKALDFETDRKPEQARALSPREVDAMTLLAMGYNRAQVAHSLSISEHTLRVYIESARFKLGALNTTHAIATAMSRGLIVV